MKIALDKAKDLLLKGDVVAIPTETVYGLAGWIHSEEGLRKIFSTKERPFFDPLIVHVGSIKEATDLCSEWTEIHEALALAFWPGPLTLIAPKNEKVNPLITAGLESVGLRCPNHPETIKLLKSIPGGLAAPSANKFGKTSPTNFMHVEEEFGGKVAVIDGGDCQVGIESTVAGVEKCNGGWEIKIFRPGFITATHVTDILSDRGLKARVSYAKSPVAPGQLEHHYMPKIPLIIVPSSFDWKRERDQIESKLHKEFLNPISWKLNQDPNIASRELYHQLRTFDTQGYDLILAYKDSQHESEDWMGIWNRLEKAKTLALR